MVYSWENFNGSLFTATPVVNGNFLLPFEISEWARIKLRFSKLPYIPKPTSVILSESSRTGSIQNKCSHLILLKKDELQPPVIVFLQKCIGFIRICHHIYRIFPELLNKTNNLSTNSTGTNRQEHQYLNSMAIDLMPNAMLSRQTTSKILLTENKIRRKLQVL